jgi:hypothetical protein
MCFTFGYKQMGLLHTIFFCFICVIEMIQKLLLHVVSFAGSRTNVAKWYSIFWKCYIHIKNCVRDFYSSFKILFPVDWEPSMHVKDKPVVATTSWWLASVRVHFCIPGIKSEIQPKSYYLYVFLLLRAWLERRLFNCFVLLVSRSVSLQRNPRVFVY